MSRGKSGWRCTLGLATALLAVGSLPSAAATPSDPTCRRRPLVDAATGAAVHGAEDLAYDASSGLLYVSTYDRHALDDAVDAGVAELPQGAIHTVPAADLADGSGPVPLRDVSSPAMAGRDLHPHGIALIPDRGLAAVNHAYVRVDGGWRREARIELFRRGHGGMTHTGTVTDAALCRANDLAALGPSTLRPILLRAGQESRQR